MRREEEVRKRCGAWPRRITPGNAGVPPAWEGERRTGRPRSQELRPRRLARVEPRTFGAHERLRFSERQRLAEEEALHLIARVQLQERPLLFRLHAFGDDGEPQR